MKALRRLPDLFRRSKLDRETDDELRFHIEEQTQRNLATGMALDDAELAARRQFGWRDRIREEVREQHGGVLVDALMKDLRHGVRTLRKSPAFTTIAVATLALGIGVNTAMFSVINTVLLNPAPYPAPEQLVRVYRTSPQSSAWPHSAPNLADLQANCDSLAALAAFHWWTFSLSEPGQPAELLQGIVASAELFDTIAVQPAIGRAFKGEEQQPGRDQVIVLTDAFWRSRFGADPDIVGRVVRINGTPLTVIGVMPPEFAYPLFWGKVDAIRPLVLAADWQNQRNENFLDAIARVKPGVSIARAQAEAAAIAARLAQQYPDSNAETSIRLVPLHETAVGSTGRTVSWLTLGLSGFVLLIACVNLANLQLARGAARAREFAVRAALGASRGRLMCQLLTESVLLALAGGALGVLLAVWLDAFLSRRLDLADGMPFSIALDWTVLAFALIAAFASGLFSGAVPAWLSARADVNHALKQQTRGTTSDRVRHRLRHALIATEVAFALVLLAGAGFFIRGLQRFAARDPGWQPAGLITGMISLPKTLPTDRYIEPGVRRTFYEQLLQRLSGLPGVESAALASSLPVTAYRSSSNFVVEGRADPPAGHEPLAATAVVSREFFNTLRLPLLDGRTFPPDLRADGPRAVVINQSMAQHFWPGESAIGKRIGGTDPNDRTWAEVIGVVRDAGFVASFDAQDSPWQVYYSLVQQPWGYLRVALRARNAASLAGPLRRTVAELDPDLPVAWVTTVDDAVGEAHHKFRIANQLLASFALLGLALAAVGLYGVISTVVVQRSQEFGIRLALGARARSVFWLILGQCITLAAIGSCFGLPGAVALNALLGRLMPGLPGSDPLVLGAIVALLLAVALTAGLAPARRATKVDPMVALRAE